MDFDEKGQSLSERVFRHLAGIEEFLKVFSEQNFGRTFAPLDYPSPEEIQERALVHFYRTAQHQASPHKNNSSAAPNRIIPDMSRDEEGFDTNEHEDDHDDQGKILLLRLMGCTFIRTFTG